MSLSNEIKKELQARALEGSLPFLDCYLDHETAILGEVNSLHGIKSEFYCYDLKEFEATTKLLAIFSDFISAYTAPSINSDYHLQMYEEGHPRYIDRRLTIPASLTSSTLNKGFPIDPMYILKNDAEIRRLAEISKEFVQHGSLLMRPLRGLRVVLPPGYSDVHHDLYYASGDSPNDHWFAKEANENDNIVLKYGIDRPQFDNLFEITVPYFEGISMADLAKILKDETDILSKFRVTLKQLAKDLPTSPSEREEYVQDRIRPELDAIERKFKLIKGHHRLAVGASVAAFTLTLLGVTVTPAINFQTLFQFGMGGGALGIVASEIRFQAEEDKLKDNPYFLLWKISRKK